MERGQLTGEQKLGESTTPPYRVAWKGVKAGVYELTARASGPTGEAIPSPPVSVEVK